MLSLRGILHSALPCLIKDRPNDLSYQEPRTRHLSDLESKTSSMWSSLSLRLLYDKMAVTVICMSSGAGGLKRTSGNSPSEPDSWGSLSAVRQSDVLLFKLVSLNSTDWKELGWDFPALATITQTEQPEQPHPQVPSLVPLSTETILGQQGVTEKTQAPNPDSQSRLCSQRSRLPLGFLSFSGKWAPPRTWSSCSFPTCSSAGQVLIGRRGMTG